MSNQCSSANSGKNESAADKGINGNQEEKKKELQLADIFRKPEILFPKRMEANNEDNDHSQTMEEDDLEILNVEGDRKRSRGMTGKSHVEHTMIVQDQQNKQDRTSEPCNTDGNFLLVGPGGARQGQ
ncbi:hypothetical protein P8452_74683 [Trifolium repens]|nr:hypothetical protein P8452_74683 [Trifolium repens]